MEEKLRLRLRVFKRSNKYLALLWRKIDGVDPLTAEITFKDIKPGSKPVVIDPRFLDLNQDLSDDEKKKNGREISESTVICVIREIDAGLNPEASYYVKVRYGDSEEGVKLSPAGIFPPHEKERRESNVHLWAWSEEKQHWRKLSGVLAPDGSFCLPVYIVNKDEFTS